MSETPDLEIPDLDVPDVPDVDTPDVDTPDGGHDTGYDADADYDRAVQLAGDAETTTDARGNTVLAEGVDPLAVIERTEAGITWPDGAAPMPVGFTGLTAEARTDWLIDAGWDGIITADGYPVAADPWGDPLGDPTDPSTVTEPALPAPGGTRPMGGPDEARKAARDHEESGKHGQVKGIGGGTAKRKKRAPLGAKVGRGDGDSTGGGGGNSLIRIDILRGAGSGNSLVRTGDVATVKPSGNTLIGGPNRPSRPRAAGAKFGNGK